MVTKINELGSKLNNLSVLILIPSSFYDEKAYYKIQLESIPIHLHHVQLRFAPAPTDVSEMLVQ